LLVADVYYSVVPGREGLHFHTDSGSSFCLLAPETPGVSFWLALDDVDACRGGGLEVCSLQAPENCTVYQLRRGDAILFSRHAVHRTARWRRGVDSGGRRALVGRFVPRGARLAVAKTPPALVATNGFDGQYLCEHGLAIGTPLQESACFGTTTTGSRRLTSPLWPLLEHSVHGVISAMHGARLSQAAALVLTLVVELFVADAMMAGRCLVGGVAGGGGVADVTKGRWRLLAACAAGTLLTHPVVWFWALVLFPTSPPVIREGVVEALVVLVEAAVLMANLNNLHRRCGGSALIALSVAAIMNIASVSFGYMLSDALDLRSGGFAVGTSITSWLLGLMLLLRLRGAA